MPPFARKWATSKRNPSLRGGRSFFQESWQKDPLRVPASDSQDFRARLALQAPAQSRPRQERARQVLRRVLPGRQQLKSSIFSQKARGFFRSSTKSEELRGGSPQIVFTTSEFPHSTPPIPKQDAQECLRRGQYILRIRTPSPRPVQFHMPQNGFLLVSL